MHKVVSGFSGCVALASFAAAAIALPSACGSQTGSGGFTNGAGDDSSATGSPGSSGGTSGGSSGGTSSSGSSGSSGSGAASSGGSGGGSSSGGTGHSDSGRSGDGGASTGALCLQGGSGDYANPGPYAVSTSSVDLADAGLSGAASPTTFTIYYPTTMEANCPHPIAAWGNGTGVDGQGYSFFNTNLASWGIVVIASDNPEVGASPYLSTGIDYLVAQNASPGSIFYHKLSAKAGVAGHSQGGIAASAATMNPNVVSEVCVEGGGSPKQGTSVLCLTGSNTDGGLNPVNAFVLSQTYPATTGPAFLADWDGGDHVTTPTELGWVEKTPGTLQFVRLMTAWYRCYLASDSQACSLFQGYPDCGICKDPGWYLLESKNL